MLWRVSSAEATLASADFQIRPLLKGGHPMSGRFRPLWKLIFESLAKQICIPPQGRRILFIPDLRAGQHFAMLLVNGAPFQSV